MMAGVTITARVRWDGALTIPKQTRETLGLHKGDQVEITLNRRDVPPEDIEDDPLLAIIGIGKGGPVDGAEDHDSRNPAV